MPFYLRKSYRSGPVRFNLSKGGIGLSAGITGARLGINKNGVYVHGGRHGLYYRKHLRGNKNSRTSGRTDRETLYVDTGLTYNGLELPDTFVGEPPPAPQRFFIKLIAFFIAVILMFSQAMFAKLLGIGIITGLIVIRWNRKRAPKALEKTQQLITEKKKHSLIFKNCSKRAPWFGKPREWFEKQTGALLLASFFDDEVSFSPENIDRIKSELHISDERWQEISLAFFHVILEDALSDHQLSKEEETALSTIAELLEIDNNILEKEWQWIEMLRSVRDESLSELKAIDVTISLKRGEICYFKTQGRLLKEIVLNRFQKNNVAYREVGFEVDIEGDIYITNKQIIFSGTDERTYPISRVRDVILSVKEQTVELTLSNRKSPLIVTSPEAARLAMFINKVSDEEN